MTAPVEVSVGESAGGRIPEIDWLRGVAALGVFVFHASVEVGFPSRTLPPIDLPWGRRIDGIPSVTSFGATGVNLFFVISGFCLALQQLRLEPAALRGRQLRGYFLGRVARIVPAYWVAVLFSAVLCLVVSVQPVRQSLEDVGLHLFFLHGLDRTRFLRLNGALWSMATEVQFYLVFPWLLRLFVRVGTARFLLLTGCVNLVFRVAFDAYPFVDGPGAGVSTAALLSNQLPGRLWEFALGMGLAERYLKRAPADRRLFAWAWAPALTLAIWCRLSFPVVVNLAFGLFYASLAGLVLIARDPATAEAGPLLRFLNSWGARFGRASYSFFLIHVPLLAVIQRVVGHDESRPYTAFATLTALGFPMTLGAAILLYNNVELPAWRRLRPARAR